ncbi:hypothetical protein D3C73_900400 [compost metagenome]
MAVIGQGNRLGLRTEPAHANHRAKDLFTPQRTVQRHVSEHRRLQEITTRQVRRSITATDQPRSGVQAAIDVPEHTLVLRLIDQRPHFHVRIEWVSHANGFGTGLQAREEFIEQFVGNQHATGGRTHLPGIEETATAGHFHSQIEIGIGQHQQRRFTAQFQAHAFDGFGGALHDLYAHRIAACEGHLGDARVRCQRRAHGEARAADHIEHALRQPGLGDDRSQFQLRQRRHFGGFEYHAAAGGQGGGKLPGGSDHREIPRHDQPDHAARLTTQACAEVIGRQFDDAVLPDVQPFGQTCVVLEGGDHVIDVDGRFELRLAVVARLQLHQLRTTARHASRDPAQDGAALGTGGLRPGFEGFGGGTHRVVDRLGIAAIDRGQQRFGGRVDHPQVFVASGPLAVDVQAVECGGKAHFDTAFIHCA